MVGRWGKLEGGKVGKLSRWVVEWLDGDANRRSASEDGGSKSKSKSLSLSTELGGELSPFWLSGAYRFFVREKSMNHHEEREEHEGKDGMKRYVFCPPFVSLVLFVVRKKLEPAVALNVAIAQ